MFVNLNITGIPADFFQRVCVIVQLARDYLNGPCPTQHAHEVQFAFYSGTTAIEKKVKQMTDSVVILKDVRAIGDIPLDEDIKDFDADQLDSTIHDEVVQNLESYAMQSTGADRDVRKSLTCSAMNGKGSNARPCSQARRKGYALCRRHVAAAELNRKKKRNVDIHPPQPRTKPQASESLRTKRTRGVRKCSAMCGRGKNVHQCGQPRKVGSELCHRHFRA